MFLPGATADSPDMADLADTRVVPRVVTVSVVCTRDQVSWDILRRRHLHEPSLMRHARLHRSLPEISIISAGRVNEGTDSETIATDANGAGAMDIRTLIRT
jgi:hypothetical protein